MWSHFIEDEMSTKAAGADAPEAMWVSRKSCFTPSPWYPHGGALGYIKGTVRSFSGIVPKKSPVWYGVRPAFEE